MTTLGIVGAGAVGQMLAGAVVAAAPAWLGLTRLCILARTHEQGLAWASDLSDMAVCLDSRVTVAAVSDASGLKACDAVVIAVRAPFTNTCESNPRMGGLLPNGAVIRDLAVGFAGYAGHVLIVTNPVDIMARLFAELSGCGSVYGVGSALDGARFRQAYAQMAGVTLEDVDASVCGEHGVMALCRTPNRFLVDLVACKDEALRDRPKKVREGVGRVRAGAAGAVMSALSKVMNSGDGAEVLSTRYRGGAWLGLPIMFSQGAPSLDLSRTSKHALEENGIRLSSVYAELCSDLGLNFEEP